MIFIYVMKLDNIYELVSIRGNKVYIKNDNIKMRLTFKDNGKRLQDMSGILVLE
jgi:hypothetical protein